MNKNDFWTTIIAAISALLAASPTLIAPSPAIGDQYGALRILLLIGPVAMIVLAFMGRRYPNL
jgi:hypothetical protein